MSDTRRTGTLSEAPAPADAAPGPVDAGREPAGGTPFTRGGRTAVTVSSAGVVTGNTYDKYGSGNPLVRRMMAGFERQLDELLERADPESLLDVGCGEGVLVHRWAGMLEGRRLVGVDLEEESLQAGWAQRQAPNLEYRIGQAESLPFADGEFDTVSAIEVLEHLPDPGRTLREMARCARSHLLVSVPREPLWRILNMARGAYWGALGNTPGHLNHWSRHGLVELLGRSGQVVEVRTPLPWTLALVRL